MNYLILIIIILFFPLLASAAGTWTPDPGDGTYKNPIIYADYSDPDVVRVGDDFFMTSSSFNCFPALPILHSKDLVNWKIINHAIKSWPDDYFDIPQHGNGIWAPSLRYHDGFFWIFYGDPDQGIFMVKTRNIYADWEPPVLVKQAKGWIDPCPLWDDDGQAYLVQAFANSRAGVKSILHINKMSPDGTRLLDEGTLVFDGHAHHPTIEGPKFYEMNGYYYIFAPAGGVPTGWQTILRSKNVFGPYQDKIVLAQGNTSINGPHQGGYIGLENGDGWFVHFQDVDPYGQITHLQPVVWKNDWPVMGIDEDNDGTGEPVLQHQKPFTTGKTFIQIPQTTDKFEEKAPGLQWQWHANPQKEWFEIKEGALRLYSQPLPSYTNNFWQVGNLFLQKFPAPEFIVTTKMEFHPKTVDEKAGLIIMGLDYSYIAINKTVFGYELVQVMCQKAPDKTPEKIVQKMTLTENSIYLRIEIKPKGLCTFFYSHDGKEYFSIGEIFAAQPGKWIGAKVGLFAIRPTEAQKGGYANFDFFQVD
jgi:beta-xylosidase